MRDRWLRLWCSLGGDAAAGEAAWLILEALYSTPARSYHNLDHIRDCLYTLDRYMAVVSDVPSIEFAVFLHDCVYVSTNADNESRSADVAVLLLRAIGADAQRQRIVRDLIDATRHDGRPLAGDQAIMVDVDLSILASTPTEYDAYAAAIRREYSMATDQQYASGRTAFLSGMLQRNRIFAMEAIGAELESAARANLAKELSRLIA